MKAIRPIWVIQLFAVLHAVTALICHIAGITDEMLLTLLTMLMIIIVCMLRRMKVEATAIAIILGNIAGYAIGSGLAAGIAVLSHPSVAVNAIGTFITTEILGFTILFLSRYFKHSDKEPGAGKLVWIIAAVAVVYMVRLVFSFLFNYKIVDTSGLSKELIYFLSVFATLTVVIVICVIAYAIRTSRKAEKEKEKRHLAQFRYLKLNQQVNPHFLFNSLNILDCLVTEGKDSDAHDYIHKLAFLYRYMLKSEDEVLVKLSEEMEFVQQYVDLMKVRFPEGLEVEVDIPEESLSKHVVPCSVQLLIENATKHNTISAGKPLHISIQGTDGSISVRNNISPKLTPVQSTGLGLKYIRQQYMDISGSEITISDGPDDYIVTLPIL